jgi:hypothetical protein
MEVRMIASVHVADVGLPSALAVLRKAPKADKVPGLRHADVGSAAPLGGSVFPSPQLGRVGLVAFWDDDAALDAFLASHPLADRLAGGWHLRLEPRRAHGSWPGLPDDVNRSRAATDDGPVAVLTLGRLRYRRAIPFFRASNKAENAVVAAPGLIWTTGMARPPFLATCSLWESATAAAAYAYGTDGAAHPSAITVDRAKPFHHQSAFIRFRPYGSVGHLDGKNPLAEHWLDSSVRPTPPPPA